MKMKWLFCLISFLFSIQAGALTPEDVVSSSFEHFPKIIESMQQLEETKGLVLGAEGSFDAKIKGEVDSRTQGFYTGDAYKAQIEKPIPYFNSRVYGGQRQGFGSFPSYEGKYETFNGGEAYAGVSISLLRNSLIDSNRYRLRKLKQGKYQAEVDLKRTQLDIQTQALKAYWMWLVKGHELKVHQDILSLAQKRAKQIARRIKLGDLARIYETENNQYIRKRESQVALSQLEFQEAKFYLSLFYRDNLGKPQTVGIERLPPVDSQKLQRISNALPLIEKAQNQNLELQILQSVKKQAQLDVRMGRNELLPKVDVNFEWNQDQGQGPNRLAGDENRIMLKLEVPLEYRKGRGKRNAGLAKIEQTKTKEGWVMDKLQASIQILVTKINSLGEIFDISLDQITLADKMAKAERRKFSQGASDLILVNLREENLAQAQIKNLSTLLKYNFIDADLKESVVQFIVDPGK